MAAPPNGVHLHPAGEPNTAASHLAQTVMPFLLLFKRVVIGALIGLRAVIIRRWSLRRLLVLVCFRLPLPLPLPFSISVLVKVEMENEG